MHKVLIRGLFVICFMAVSSAFAEEQVINRFKIGSFDIIAMQHQNIEHGFDKFRSTEPEFLEASFKEIGANKSALNTFIVDTGEKKILFDTGKDDKIVELIEKSGLFPEEIDIVVITHMHKDHIGGLLTETLTPVFPNAIIYISEEEIAANPNDYVIAAYKDKIVAFKPNDAIVEGVVSASAFGHTPGHSFFEISNGDDKLLILGDFIHAAVQFKYPEVYLTYDLDANSAAELRKKVLEKLSYEDTIIAGMHLAYPGYGRVTHQKTWYEFAPAK